MDDQEFETALAELTADRKHGASELARRCLDTLSRSAGNASATDGDELAQLLKRRCDRLIGCRPSMAPIRNLLAEWRLDLDSRTGLSLQALRAAAMNTADDLIRRSGEAVQQTVAHAVEQIGDGKRIITHSLSSTVLAVFERLKDRKVQAVITESRPLNEGYLLASRLAEWEIPTELITEAQMGLAVAQADLALVGADTLLPDGSLVNKAGTYLLALAARDRGVPFWVCCESFKRIRERGWETELEEMDATELSAPDLPGTRIRNRYFDITPARLISLWIDEKGIYQTLGDFEP